MIGILGSEFMTTVTMCFVAVFNKSIIRGTKGMNSLGHRLKMLWINTKRILAVVMQHYTIWYRTLKQLIGKTMGKHVFTIASIKSPITEVDRCPKPKPAGRSFLNFAPKSFSFIHRWLPRSVYNQGTSIPVEPHIVGFTKRMSNGCFATTLNQANTVFKFKPDGIPYITHTNIVMDGLLNVKS